MIHLVSNSRPFDRQSPPINNLKTWWRSLLFWLVIQYFPANQIAPNQRRARLRPEKCFSLTVSIWAFDILLKSNRRLLSLSCFDPSSALLKICINSHNGNNNNIINNNIDKTSSKARIVTNHTNNNNSNTVMYSKVSMKQRKVITLKK